MAKKSNFSPLFFTIILLGIMGGIVFLYNSSHFEQEKPSVIIDDEIYWNTKRPLNLRIEDNSGIKYFAVTMKNGDKNKILTRDIFDVPKKRIDINLENFKGGVIFDSDKAELIIEAIDGSRWNWFAGNNIKKRVKVVIDKKRPRLSTVTHSYKIRYGGSALIIFKASDTYLKDIYIESGGKKRFKAMPFYKDGYYISLVGWPIGQRRFRATIYATDEAGNISRSHVPFHQKYKYYKESSITINDNFLDGKIAELALDLEEELHGSSNLESFKIINESVRKKNEELISQITSAVDTNRVDNFSLNPFYPLKNGAAVASFGDYRKFFYNKKFISESYHLGLDLASVKMAKIVSRNSAEVRYSEENGIYGNMLILHHGLGLHSLYGHCSSFEVEAGDIVSEGDHLANTGKSGLALGDHLHFGVLVQGVEVRPEEWMDEQWIRLNIIDIIGEAKKIINRG